MQKTTHPPKATKGYQPPNPNALRKVAVITGGGDAQGMNAALRAVSRIGIRNGWTVYGIRDGFFGLYRLGKCEQPFSVCDQDRPIVEEMTWEYMSWAIRDGGSVLGTIRYVPLRDDLALRETIVKKLTQDSREDGQGTSGLGVDALIVIGGNGSLQGAYALASTAQSLMRRNELDRPLSVVAVPASIDNDIPETEISIGVDSALNIIVESIDKLVDTTSAVNRAIVVETMGRDCGYLAVFGALASGAEDVFSPERPITSEAVNELVTKLCREYASLRRNAVVVVGEGGSGRGVRASQYIVDSINVNQVRFQDEQIPWDVRKSELGHLQRGGPTSAFDRLLGTRMGASAVELLRLPDAHLVPKMVRLRGGRIEPVQLETVIEKIRGHQAGIDRDVLLDHARLVKKLSSIPPSSKPKGQLVALTGGADAQGMNMALRAVSRYALNEYSLTTLGSINGFDGLIHNQMMPLTWDVVSRSGTRSRRAGSVIGAKRWPIPFTDEEKKSILNHLKKLNDESPLRGLVLIGGLGTAMRARELHDYFRRDKFHIPIVYIPASIDHGLPSTHATLGFDSALNVVVQSCDRIIDTGQAMYRLSIVDTMGGGVGALTLMGALAAGAECAIVLEDFDNRGDSRSQMIPLEEATSSLRRLKKSMLRDGRHFATVLLQHHQFEQLSIARLHGRADELFNPVEVRKTELGHTQRGGNASYYDRLLGTLMGVEAVKVIMQKKGPGLKMLCQLEGEVKAVDLKSALENRKGGPPWGEATRMENAKPLWQYDEIKDLFEKMSVNTACSKEGIH